MKRERLHCADCGAEIIQRAEIDDLCRGCADRVLDALIPKASESRQMELRL